MGEWKREKMTEEWPPRDESVVQSKRVKALKRQNRESHWLGVHFPVHMTRKKKRAAINDNNAHASVDSPRSNPGGPVNANVWNSTGAHQASPAP